MKRFENKTVFVAGGARDIGRACAIRFAQEGAKVAISYNGSADAAQNVVEEIKDMGSEAIALQADLTSDAAANQTVATIVTEFGEIDAYIHVTGGMVQRRKLNEMDVDFWHEVMDLNVTSLFLTTKAVLPQLRKGGAIVTFSSQAGRDGGGDGAIAYATSKGAVMTFTRGLAKELGANGRANAVCPGMISTLFHDTFTTDENRANVAAATALGREGKSADVAGLVTFLASDDAAYCTGVCYDINGGVLFS